MLPAIKILSNRRPPLHKQLLSHSTYVHEENRSINRVKPSKCAFQGTAALPNVAMMIKNERNKLHYPSEECFSVMKGRI